MVQKWNQEEIRKYFELNENENTTYKKLQNAARAVLTGKFIALNVYVLERRKTLNQ